MHGSTILRATSRVWIGRILGGGGGMAATNQNVSISVAEFLIGPRLVTRLLDANLSNIILGPEG